MAQDIFASMILNPNLNMKEIIDVGGLNASNSQLLNKEDYLKLNGVQNAAMF